MDDVESKLRDYRAKQRRDRYKKTFVSYLKKPMDVTIDATKTFLSKIEEKVNKPTAPSPSSVLAIPAEQQCDDPDPYVEDDDDDDESFGINWLKVACYALLWTFFYTLAIYAQFGCVYFLLSGFVCIWMNTSTGRKRRGISAYSVFNPNCERIQGTVDAQQLQNEMFYVF